MLPLPDFCRKYVYTFGRLAGVGSRPLLLFLANNYFLTKTSVHLGVAMLSSALAMSAISADVHRNYYLKRFSDDRVLVGLSFFNYFFSLLIMGLVGICIALCVGMKSGLASVAVCSVLFFCSEKLADEVLRFELFNKSFEKWGWLSAGKGLFQILFILFVFFFMGTSTPSWFIILGLSVVSFLVFGFSVPSLFFVGLKKVLVEKRWKTLKKSFKFLFDIRWLWVLLLMSTMIGYLDRIFILRFSKDILPVFMIVVTGFSVIQMGMDFYFFSPRRQDFLNKKLTLDSIFRNKTFWITLGISTILGVGCGIFAKMISKGGDMVEFSYLPLIAFSQIMYTLIIIPQQLLYWENLFKPMLYVDAAFWFCVGGLLLAGSYFGGLFYILLAMCGFLFFRTSAYYMMVNKYIT